MCCCCPFVSHVPSNIQEYSITMKKLPNNRQALLAVISLASLPLLAIGCGETAPDRSRVVPVDGAVTFEGQPLPGAMIVLHPKSGGRSGVPSPRAQVAKDGTFRFTTYDADDGAPPGEYVATIAWYKLVGQGGDVKAGPNVLPPRFSNPKTSQWLIRVADQPTRLSSVQLRR
jgi:hypothetical protein